MIAYVSCAEILGGRTTIEAHSLTYAELKKHVDQDDYYSLTQKDAPYRNEMEKNGALFAQQLPVYQIRIIYISSMLLLMKSGMNPFFASHFISALSAFFALIILGLIVFRFYNKIWILLFPIVLSCFGLMKVARLSTPDSMAFLYTIILAFFVSRKQFSVVLWILPLSVAIRTDMILIVLLMAILFYFLDRKNLKWYGLSSAISFTLYSYMNSYYGHYGWHTLFYTTLIDHVVNPADQKVTVTEAAYFRALLSGVFELLKEFRPIFLLFPVAWERFFWAQYSILFVIVISLIQRSEKSCSRPH